MALLNIDSLCLPSSLLKIFRVVLSVLFGGPNKSLHTLI